VVSLIETLVIPWCLGIRQEDLATLETQLVERLKVEIISSLEEAVKKSSGEEQGNIVDQNTLDQGDRALQLDSDVDPRTAKSHYPISLSYLKR
jgi:hypothetical protein